MSASTYYPFGMTQWSAGATDYLCGMQGQMQVDEMHGEGNWSDFKYRGCDPRLGRFFSIDPLVKKYPWNSPYAFSENDVIGAVELEGLEKHKLNNGETKHGTDVIAVNLSKIS